MIATCAGIPVPHWLRPITQRLVEGKYVAVMIAPDARYKFNLDGVPSGWPVVVFDYSEYGVEESWKNEQIFGLQWQLPAISSHEEYFLLDNWLAGQKVIAYFKRELTPTIKAPCPVYPIDLLSDQHVSFTPTLAQWMNRLGGVFHLYGYSHPDRKRLHAALQEKWECTINHLGAMSACFTHQQPFHMLEQVDYRNRYPMSYVLASQSGCQLSVALPGYGVKTFRHSESAQNCVPVIADLGVTFAVPWTNENAVLLPTENGRLKIQESVAVLEAALADREALFQKLAPAIDAARQLEDGYFVERFINRHILEHL